MGGPGWPQGGFPVAWAAVGNPTGRWSVSRHRPGGGGDPTIVGATLRVYNAAGSGEEVQVILPASGWKATRNGYRFRSAGPVTAATLKPDRLSISAGQAVWNYTLDEPEQRRMAVRLTLGTSVQGAPRRRRAPLQAGLRTESTRSRASPTRRRRSSARLLPRA